MCNALLLQLCMIVYHIYFTSNSCTVTVILFLAAATALSLYLNKSLEWCFSLGVGISLFAITIILCCHAMLATGSTCYVL